MDTDTIADDIMVYIMLSCHLFISGLIAITTCLKHGINTALGV